MNAKIYKLLGIYEEELQQEIDIYIAMAVEYLENTDVRKDENSDLYIVAVSMLTKAFFDNEVDELPDFFNAIINQLKLGGNDEV